MSHPSPLGPWLNRQFVPIPCLRTVRPQMIPTPRVSLSAIPKPARSWTWLNLTRNSRKTSRTSRRGYAWIKTLGTHWRASSEKPCWWLRGTKLYYPTWDPNSTNYFVKASQLLKPKGPSILSLFDCLRDLFNIPALINLLSLNHTFSSLSSLAPSGLRMSRYQTSLWKPCRRISHGWSLSCLRLTNLADGLISNLDWTISSWAVFIIYLIHHCTLSKSQHSYYRYSDGASRPFMRVLKAFYLFIIRVIPS